MSVIKTPMKSFKFNIEISLRLLNFASLLRSGIVAVAAVVCFFSLPVYAQQTDSPVVVQPGAPGQPTKILPSTTRAKLPPRSPKDVEFMQGMIMHHAQAVEMTAMIAARSKNKKIRLLGARISQSQSAEMNFMKRWLENRGEKTSMTMMKMPEMNMSEMDMPGMNMSSENLMPGMLTAKQMKELSKAKEAEFDRLFLQGMIQHHSGALTMVDDLFKTTGAGQDAEVFNFATDVDSGQRAEIRIMQTLLGEKP